MRFIFKFGRMALEFLLSIAILFCIFLSNIILLPFARIPVSKHKNYQLKVKLKAIKVACLYRDSAESFLGNKLLFFSESDTSEAPHFLYIKKKSLKAVPLEILNYERSIRGVDMKKKTLMLEVITKKSLLCGYLPAKVLRFEVLSEAPEVGK